MKIVIPESFVDKANAIMRALDPDTGGDKTFVKPEDGGIWCDIHPDFVEAAIALHDFVVADYAARWGEFEVPTLADCEAFIGFVVHDSVEPLVDEVAILLEVDNQP